ncbi:MAG: DUF362 domain-containing protein [Candidatus Helarchaeota archaeon]
MSNIAIAHGPSILKNLKQVLNRLGGISRFIPSGSTVFIKPDITLPISQPVTIHPSILGYLLKACHKSGAKTIYIGFNPFDGVSSARVLQLLGIEHYIEDLGGTILTLETESYIPIEVEHPFFFTPLYVPEKLAQSDVFLSIIAPRTDVYDQVALGLRNYYDLLNDQQKHELLRSGSSIGLLDFYQTHPPTLSIWDAFYVGDGQGPFSLNSQPYHLILSSENLLAGDCIMAQMMGFELSQITILKTALEKKFYNLQQNDLNEFSRIATPHHRKCQPAIQSLQNTAEWFKVIEGNCCAGCKIALRYLLDFLSPFIAKDLKEFGGFSCFIGQNLQTNLRSLMKGVIFFGTCAIKSGINRAHHDGPFPRKYTFSFPGCPPLSLRTLESFCVDFKKWLPSLEIIEEFIRQWTGGRHYRSPSLNSDVSPNTYLE